MAKCYFMERSDTLGYFNIPMYRYKFRIYNAKLGYLEFGVNSKSKNIRSVKVLAKLMAKNFALHNSYFDWRLE